MEWYDKIAGIYDLCTTHFYKKMRKSLIEELKIQRGDRVLVIACGTGQSLELIENSIGEKGEIIAMDYSKKMLEKAEERIKKNDWKNITLIRADARELDVSFFEKRDIDPYFDVLIGELAFSVIPGWKQVMESGNSLLKANGSVGLLDWYREKNDWLTKIVDFFAEAETSRNTLKYAHQTFENLKIKKKFFFGNVYVAVFLKNFA